MLTVIHVNGFEAAKKQITDLLTAIATGETGHSPNEAMRLLDQLQRLLPAMDTLEKVVGMSQQKGNKTLGVSTLSAAIGLHLCGEAGTIIFDLNTWSWRPMGAVAPREIDPLRLDTVLRTFLNSTEPVDILAQPDPVMS